MKIILFLLCLLTLSCENKKDEFERYILLNNDKINDTTTLCDGHLYYYISTHSGKQPIHSQYCKCFKKI